MNRRLSTAIRILRWTVGLVILLQAALLAFESSRVHDFAKSGLPHWIRPAIAYPEMVAIILFLIPATSAVASRFLLVILAIAALIHVLHGQYDVSVLCVYAAGVLVVECDRRDEIARAQG